MQLLLLCVGKVELGFFWAYFLFVEHSLQRNCHLDEVGLKEGRSGGDMMLMGWFTMMVTWAAQFKIEAEIRCSVTNFEVKIGLTRPSGPHFHDFIEAAY